MVVILLKEVALIHLDTVIPAHTRVVVDESKAVAFWDGVHFEIYPDEYTLIH